MAGLSHFSFVSTWGLQYSEQQFGISIMLESESGGTVRHCLDFLDVG